MVGNNRRAGLKQLFAALLFATAVAAYAQCDRSGPDNGFAVAKRDLAGAEALGTSITTLSGDVHPEEARRVAECAYRSAEQLTRNYRVVGPPLFHNFLVNTGIRKRGLCFQWAEDLLAQLDRLKLRTLELHWGEARAGTWREHNCVVVTATGQPFRTGIILDCWRHSGRLYWASVRTDHYPWVEDSNYARIARARAAAAWNRHLAFEMSIGAKLGPRKF